MFPKIGVFTPPNHPCLIGVSIIFTIHFGGFSPYFWFNLHMSISFPSIFLGTQAAMKDESGGNATSLASMMLFLLAAILGCPLGSSQTLRAFQTRHNQFPIVQPNTCCIAIKSSFQKDLPTNTKKNTKSDMSPESRNSATSGQASIGCNQLLQFPYLAKVVTATRKAKIHQKLHSK